MTKTTRHVLTLLCLCAFAFGASLSFNSAAVAEEAPVPGCCVYYCHSECTPQGVPMPGYKPAQHIPCGETANSCNPNFIFCNCF